MAAVDQKIVAEALAKRKSFILDNLESMTLKILRKHLEEDLGLEADALKPFKKMIGEYVDTLMAPPAAEEPEEEEAASDSGSDSEEEEEEKGKKSSKKRKSSSPKPAAAAPKAAARTYSKKVDRMRNMCRQATITVPPNIYVKNKTDKELEAAFEALLEKNGLSSDAGANEIAKTKAQLQIQRDLDGIDTSNIISDGRRSRRGGATNYKEMLKAASDSEGEEEENQEDSDDGSDSGSESEKEEVEASPEKKKKKDNSPPVSAKKDSPKIENSPHQAKNASAAKQTIADNDGNTALAEIGNQKKRTLIDWSDDE